MKSLILLLLAAAIGGCTHESNSPDAGPSIDSGSPEMPDGGQPELVGDEGLFFGTSTSPDAGTDSVAILLTSAGQYWLWHFNDGGLFGGAVGVGYADAGTFVTTSVEVTSDPGALAATLEGGNFDGTLTYPSGSPNPSIVFAARAVSSYVSAATLAPIVGTWATPVITDSEGYGLESQVVTISASGALTENNPLGCTATGQVAPDPSGRNYYSMQVTYGGGGCIFGSSTLSGVAILDTALDPPQLLTSALAADGSDGIVTSGHLMP